MDEKPSKNCDERWLSAFKRGDRELLESVYFDNVTKIRNYLSHGFGFTRQDGSVGRFLGIRSAFDLDCAIQDIFCRAFEFKTRASYDGRVPFAAYLNAIARNYALNTLRCREDPQDQESLEGKLQAIPGKAINDSPEHTLVRQELREVVEQFKTECDPEQLQVLTHRYLEGLSQADSAKKLGITRRRIRTVEALLRKRLMKRLEAHR